MHPEIQQIATKSLNAPWPKYLRSVQIRGLRGWAGQEVSFKFPVAAIAGENGSGKSTVLKVAAVAYAQPIANKPSFYPGNFFVDSAWDRVSNVTLTYKITEGTQERVFSHKKHTARWRLAERPKREVIFQDISRTLPIEATAGYAYIAKRDQTERSALALSPEITRYFSAVLGRSYDDARFAISRDYVSKPVGVVRFSGHEYSQFHQGAGEDATLDLMGLLENVSDTSLILIDEIEASLHPRSQRRLVHFLLWLARTKHIQVIVSTHSPYVLEELPPEARVFISRGSGGVDILYGVSPNYALNRMDDLERPDLYLFTEDSQSKLLLLEILRDAEIELSRLKIMEVGPSNMVEALGQLAHEDRLPTRALGILDADQTVKPGCECLPGTKAPERQVFDDISEMAISEFAQRLGISVASATDAIGSASCLPDHHDWIKHIASTLKQTDDYLWITACQVWVQFCMSDVEGSHLCASISEKLP